MKKHNCHLLTQIEIFERHSLAQADEKKKRKNQGSSEATKGVTVLPSSSAGQLEPCRASGAAARSVPT